jgi:hypothetical protein
MVNEAQARMGHWANVNRKQFRHTFVLSILLVWRRVVSARVHGVYGMG